MIATRQRSHATSSSSVRRPARRNAGFTLIECCTALAVAGVLVTSAVPGLRSMLDGQKLRDASARLQSDLRLARDAASTSQQNIRLTVKPASGGSCWIVHTGDADDCVCGDAGRPAQCTGGARALRSNALDGSSRVALAANAGSILFDADHGTITPTATFRLVGADGREIRHVVNLTGRVRSCSPGAAVTGLRDC